jgi:CheY-like chemotaxis protein
MRPLPHAGLPAAIADAHVLTTLPAAIGRDADRDLFDHLAVVIGVCESLSDRLAGSPQHGELARVGALAASRAVEMLSGVRAPPPTPAAANDAAASTLEAPSVLVVEDDPALLDLLTGAFRRAGFTVHGARNGREGVRMLADLKPDLMVTDIVMPEMEGIGAILEARRRSPLTRVIAISGGGQYGRSNDFLGWASELGAEEVLAKPFRVSSLITAARLVLERPRRPDRPAS